jgi:hypothetical protein
MIWLFRAFPGWEFPIHVNILRNWMTSRPNFGLKKLKKQKNFMPHPGFEKVLMRNRDFLKHFTTFLVFILPFPHVFRGFLRTESRQCLEWTDFPMSVVDADL